MNNKNMSEYRQYKQTIEIVCCNTIEITPCNIHRTRDYIYNIHRTRDYICNIHRTRDYTTIKASKVRFFSHNFWHIFNKKKKKVKTKRKLEE